MSSQPGYIPPVYNLCESCSRYDWRYIVDSFRKTRDDYATGDRYKHRLGYGILVFGAESAPALPPVHDSWALPLYSDCT